MGDRRQEMYKKCLIYRQKCCKKQYRSTESTVKKSTAVLRYFDIIRTSGFRYWLEPLGGRELPHIFLFTRGGGRGH